MYHEPLELAPTHAYVAEASHQQCQTSFMCVFAVETKGDG